MWEFYKFITFILGPEFDIVKRNLLKVENCPWNESICVVCTWSSV